MCGRTLRQLEPEISAAFSLRIAFEGRRGAAEDNGHAAQLRPKNGNISRVIADSVLLFERGIVFLVDDDQSEARQGREHGQTGSDEKLYLSPCRGKPASPALESSEPTVQRANTKGGQRGRDTLFELRRQIDLRYQQERLPARVDHPCGSGQVNLGLAAPGNSLQQRWPECQRLGHCGVQCSALVGVQRW